MTNVHQKSTVVASIHRTIKKTAKYFFYTLATVYGVSIALVFLAHFITTPKMVEMFTISDESLAKIRGPENYMISKYNDYIAQNGDGS